MDEHGQWRVIAVARFPTVEHLVSRSRGGSNNAKNLELSCEPCNRSRGATDDPEQGPPGVRKPVPSHFDPVLARGKKR